MKLVRLNVVKMCPAVILGLKETEETYYLLVKEAKRYREAAVNCRLRGGNLAMPKSRHTNQLLAESLGQAGLTRAYIGVQAQSSDGVSVSAHTHMLTRRRCWVRCTYLKQISPPPP